MGMGEDKPGLSKTEIVVIGVIAYYGVKLINSSVDSFVNLIFWAFHPRRIALFLMITFGLMGVFGVVNNLDDIIRIFWIIVSIIKWTLIVLTILCVIGLIFAFIDDHRTKKAQAYEAAYGEFGTTRNLSEGQKTYLEFLNVPAGQPAWAAAKKHLEPFYYIVVRRHSSITYREYMKCVQSMQSENREAFDTVIRAATKCVEHESNLALAEKKALDLISAFNVSIRDKNDIQT